MASGAGVGSGNGNAPCRAVPGRAVPVGSSPASGWDRGSSEHFGRYAAILFRKGVQPDAGPARRQFFRAFGVGACCGGGDCDGAGCWDGGAERSPLRGGSSFRALGGARTVVARDRGGVGCWGGVRERNRSVPGRAVPGRAGWFFTGFGLGPPFFGTFWSLCGDFVPERRPTGRRPRAAGRVLPPSARVRSRGERRGQARTAPGPSYMPRSATAPRHLRAGDVDQLVRRRRRGDSGSVGSAGSVVAWRSW
ncbi:hypothetical protein BJY22_006973 [Kribbella shirazensis]|uniref:Uncharacterized protein n=1 Tax=Kribbella shirazensis TaxID=1105143 RepID=A0A7X5VHB0_9ACTN|nr:hypothetical protein [Kribbella shirazensis]